MSTSSNQQRTDSGRGAQGEGSGLDVGHGSGTRRGPRRGRSLTPRRRGSVLIMVIAVLVLLALIGTAFITTSRSDRTTSGRVESSAQVDILAAGALNNITGQLQKNVTAARKVDLSPVGGGAVTSYATYTPGVTSPGLFGIPALSSRAPTAFGTSSSTPVWPTISAPLDAQAYVPSTRYPTPYAYPIPAYQDGTSSFYGSSTTPEHGPTYLDRTNLTDAQLLPGGQALATPNAGSFRSPIVNDTANSSFAGFTNFISTTSNPIIGQWGAYDSARRNLQIGQVVVNGVTYPALYSPLEGPNGVVVVAGDARGTGVADCGLNYVGPIAGTEFAGITFYVGVAVVDNNSAINLNTAWTQSTDYNFAATPTPVRNNRLFPTSVGLIESLPRDVPVGTDSTTSNTLDAPGFNKIFLAHRAGSFPSQTANQTVTPYVQNDQLAINDYLQPSSTSSFGVVPLFPPYLLQSNSTAYLHHDFLFATQQELEWNKLGRRLDFPGTHNYLGANQAAQMYAPFTAGDGALLAYAGGTIVPPNASLVEQYLPFSLARTSSSSASHIPPMSLSPYSSVGARGVVDTSWYGTNFNYEPSQATGQALTSNLTSLRPFAVTRNPVSQVVGFKPLPSFPDISDNPQNSNFPVAADLVVADALPPGSAPQFTPMNPGGNGPQIAYDRMNPYVPIWSSRKVYEPGDVVRYYDAVTKVSGNYYMSALVPTSALGGTYTPGTAAATAAVANTARVNGVWQPFTGTILPQKVDVNTAPFGDLWRAFYLTMASDNVAYDSNQVYDSAGHKGALADNSITPFGPHYKNSSTANAELYRGMGFAAGGAAQSLATPSQVSSALPNFPNVPNATLHPQKMFRSNVKDLSNGSWLGGSPDFQNVTEISADQMVVVRAASAAVNAEYLRSCSAQQVISATGASATGVGVSPSLRDDILRRNVAIRATVGGVANTQVMAEVYSAGKFPYITEVYYDSDPGLRRSTDDAASPVQPLGLIAIELYNPYPFAISLANFKIQRMARQAGYANNLGGIALEDVYEFGAATTATIPKGGTIVLTNLNLAAYTTAGGGTFNTAIGASTDAKVLPLDAAWVPTKATTFYVKGLETVLDKEIILSRPMKATFTAGVLTCDAPTAASATQVSVADGIAAVNNGVVGHETTEYWVPFDSIDLTALASYNEATDVTSVPGSITVTAHAYHYAREQFNWRFVYPGRYNGSYTGSPLRQQGLNTQNYPIKISTSGPGLATATNPFLAATPKLTLGVSPIATTTVNDPSRVASYKPNMPIQIANWGFGGPNALLTGDQTGVNSFPFGGFTRLGDILQVTFISPIKYRLPTLQLQPTYGSVLPAVGKAPLYVDTVSLTSDASFAEDTDTWDDGEENVGRFAPVITPYPILIGTTAYPPAPQFATQPPQGFTGTAIDEFAVSADATAITTLPATVPAPKIQNTVGFYDQTQVMYGWANRLFDQVTVTSLSRTLRTPGARSTLLPTGAALPAQTSYNTANYPGASTAGDTFGLVRPQANSAKASNFPAGTPELQGDTGVDGLININTAPLPVLAAIPWVRDPAGNTANERSMNLAIAQAIIAYREPSVPTSAGPTATASPASPGNQALPFRPFRSLFELNKVIMATINPSTGQATFTGSNSLRTGGLSATGTASAWQLLGNQEHPPTSAIQVDPSTTTYRAATATFLNGNFLTVDNGNFLPDGGSQFNPANPGTNIFASARGTPYQSNTAYTVDQIGNRNPAGDFQSQYLLMTSVSNLITVRSDTFTAYIVVEGWANAGTSSATRVIQKRYAYILDRNGAVIGVPSDVTGVSSGASVVVKPTAAGFATPGPIRKTVVPAVGSN